MQALQSALEKFDRVSLLDAPTPIQRLSRLESALGDALNGVRLYAKRDDIQTLGGGGNKLRKLEFLLGEAQAQQADTVIAVGGRQSNFARLTAAACARLGLQCELVLTQAVPRDDVDYQHNGNVLLDHLFGARIHDLPANGNALEAAQARAEVLRSEGRRVYIGVLGGSTPLGSLGYAACALEIAEQSKILGVDFNRIYVPNGSSGTHAGLAAGWVALGKSAGDVHSFSVLGEAAPTHQTTHSITQSALALIDPQLAVKDSDIHVHGGQRGTGYGIPTDAMLEAVRLLARTEGLLLDPVYSGKAFAGLLQHVREGAVPNGANVLFVMTGGSPGLYAYRPVFEGQA